MGVEPPPPWDKRPTKPTHERDAMSTATNAATATTKTAKEAREEAIAFAQAQKLPSLPVTGNTFPIKSLLWALGGTWDKEAKVWMVPQHNHTQAQAAANRFTKGTAEHAAAETEKAQERAAKQAQKQAAQASKPAPTPAAPKAERTQLPPAGTPANLKVRMSALSEVVDGVAKQCDAHTEAQLRLRAAETLIREACNLVG